MNCRINRFIVKVSCLINDVLLYFPDPFTSSLSLDPKDIYIIEHKNVRKIFNRLLIILEQTLKENLNVLQLKVILKKWKSFDVLNSYYIKKFNTKQHTFSLDEEMSAFVSLTNIMSDYRYFLQRIQTNIDHKLKY